MVTRRKYLSTVAFTAGYVGLPGCIDEDENGGISALAEWNHRVYDRVRFPGQSEDEFFESSDGSKYVGVQLAVTNVTETSGMFVYRKYVGEQFMWVPQLTLVADGSKTDVSIHPRSQTSALLQVDGGETAEATSLYVCPRDSSSYSLDKAGYFENTYEISRNEDLEIDLISVPESG